MVQKSMLTERALMAMLNAAVDEATRLGQPQCIVIVDQSAVELATLRMTGAKVLSLKSALAKARTAASIGAPSSTIPEHVRPAIAAATEGQITGLGGGLPIVLEGEVVGGVGVGSGSPEQDTAVANAALNAIGAQTFS
ncbi:MAG: heme-binding protein [Pseudomonadota bacterium]